jgi:hypothetical protein
VRGRTAVSSGVSGKPAKTSANDSPSSRMNAATYTRPTAFAIDAPATVITAPPHEWPTRSTGPSTWFT